MTRNMMTKSLPTNISGNLGCQPDVSGGGNDNSTTEATAKTPIKKIEFMRARSLPLDEIT
jgi:hypothetical protein